MERTLIAPGVHLSCDPAEKFNRCRISIHFAFPAKRETATAHALLPLVRGVVTGLQQVPQDALESATAMGMSAGQRFRQVQLPLAMPVLLRSLRVVSVQTVGMAVVAALIGAGGFGALVFQGLLSSALDLVLLGVVPTIALAVVVDALFALWGAWLKGEAND